MKDCNDEKIAILEKTMRDAWNEYCEVADEYNKVYMKLDNKLKAWLLHQANLNRAKGLPITKEMEEVLKNEGL